MQTRNSFGTGVTGEFFQETFICTEVRTSESVIRLWPEDHW